MFWHKKSWADVEVWWSGEIHVHHPESLEMQIASTRSTWYPPHEASRSTSNDQVGTIIPQPLRLMSPSHQKDNQRHSGLRWSPDHLHHQVTSQIAKVAQNIFGNPSFLRASRYPSLLRTFKVEQSELKYEIAPNANTSYFKVLGKGRKRVAELSPSQPVVPISVPYVVHTHLQTHANANAIKNAVM